VVHRCIRRNHHDDRAIGRIPPARGLQLLLEVIPSKFLPYWCSGNCQHAAKIALNQHAHGVTAHRRREPPRRGADPSFKFEGHCPRAGAHRAFFDGSALCSFDRSKYLAATYMPPANVVQVAVIRFRHHRIDGAHALVPREPQHIIQQRISHPRHVQSRGQQNRCFHFP